MSDYGYEKFTTGAYNLDSFEGPVPGDKAPDVKVATLDGATRDLLAFEGRFLVLELGSITCPLFQSRRVRMSSVVKANPDVDFAVLYVREAHPGAKIAQHGSFENKQAMAVKLRNEDGEGRPILIDDMNGTAHKAFGGYPNSVFIINQNGCVVYHSDWNNPGATATALARLKAGKQAGGQGMFLPAKPPVAFHTLRRAGGSALRDFLVGLPGLIWANVIKRNLRVLLGRKSRILPDHTC